MKTYQPNFGYGEENVEYRCPPYEDYEKYKKLNFNGLEYNRTSKIENREVGKKIGEAQLIFKMSCDRVQE